MATIALMVGSAIVNALAFTGGNYLFSKLGKQGADEERIRHDKALEEFQTAQQQYTRKRQERLDYLDDRNRAQIHSENTFHGVEQSMQEYYLLTGSEDRNIPEIDNEPKFGEFYEPSEEQKGYELLFMVIGIALTGFTAFLI